MGTVAPVAATNARLFTDMATTFEAISRDPNALEATIAESPSTEQVSTQSLKVQQPFLVDLSTLGRKFTPATAELRVALPNINPAIEVGTRTLARTPSLNAQSAAGDGRVEESGAGAGHEHRDQRADVHRDDAESDDPVSRAVSDGVRRLELLLDVSV